jgi:small subunit ribosomal protein S6
MRAYELMVIFNGELDDAGIEAGVKRIEQHVAAKAGQIATSERWGRRRFAYEIAHKHEGYYIVFQIFAGGGDLDDLERQLRLADDVVRHKLIRLPEKEAARRGLDPDAQATPAAAG